MLFRNCEHYDLYDTSQKGADCLRECYICYEINDYENQFPVKLGSQPFYIKKCTCDVFIHLSCLYSWYELSKTCPICRKEMIYNPNKKCWFYFYYLASKYNSQIFKFYMFVICFYYFFKDITFLMEIADFLYLVKDGEFI